MGKRTNTILQSAFFALANIIPQEEAIGYMKDAATKSYLKKGQDVVDMNHRAIDAGATAFVKIDIPADWATCPDKEDTTELEGRPELVKQVREIMEPVGRMLATRCPFRCSPITPMASSSRALPLTKSAAFPLPLPSGMPRSALSATAARSCVLMPLFARSA